MDIRHTGDELWSGGVAGLAAAFVLAGIGMVSLQLLQALGAVPTGRPPNGAVFTRRTLVIIGVLSVGAVLGVAIARRTEPGSPEAVQRRLRFAAAVWVLLLGIAWFLPVQTIATSFPLEDRRLVSAGVRLGAFLLVPILAVVGASPRIRKRWRRRFDQWTEISFGEHPGREIPDRWTKLGGAVVWVCGGTPATRILTESIRQPIGGFYLQYPLGFVGTALPWALLGYWWTSHAIETQAEQSHVNAARLRLLAYAGPIAISVVIGLAVIYEHLPTGIANGLGLLLVLSVPVIGVGCSYGTLLNRVNPRPVDIPCKNPLRRVIGTVPLQAIAIVFVIGIAASLGLWIGSGALGDYDRDGVTNGVEVLHGSDPAAADTDLDGLDDGREIGNETSATAEDTDGDGISDGQEVALDLNPADPDTDGDGTPDNAAVQRTVPIRRASEQIDGASVTLEGPLRSVEHVRPVVISNRTAGLQRWHVVDLGFTANDTTARVTMPVGSRTLQRHPNATVYLVAPANYWIEDGWRPVPTRVDPRNGTATATIDGEQLAYPAWITVSTPTAIRSAATTESRVPEDRYYTFEAASEWEFDGSVRTVDDRILFEETDENIGVARRTVTVPDVPNVTLAAGIDETERDAVGFTLSNDTEAVHVADDRNRTRDDPLRGEVSSLRGERVTLTIRGTNGSAVEWLWFQSHSDGDSIADTTERAAATMPGMHCHESALPGRWLGWSPLALDPSRADTDGDGFPDDVEVHLEETLADESGTLTVSLRGYNAHPNRSANWC